MIVLFLLFLLKIRKMKFKSMKDCDILIRESKDAFQLRILRSSVRKD